MKLRRTVRRMLDMKPDAWYIFLRSLQLCCVLLLCAFALLLEYNGDMLGKYSTPCFTTTPSTSSGAWASRTGRKA